MRSFVCNEESRMNFDSLVQVMPAPTNHRAGIVVDECTQREVKCIPGIVPHLDFRNEKDRDPSCCELASIEKDRELPPELLPLSLLRTRTPEETALEVYSDRPFFKLKVGMFRITCRIGTSFCLSRQISVQEQDGIRTAVTHASALDVYERYGLDVTLTLLKAQLDNTRRGTLSTFYLAIYLIGSMAAMEEDVTDFITVLNRDRSLVHETVHSACSHLRDLLIKLEEKQFGTNLRACEQPRCSTSKRPTEEQPCEQSLPCELLALIFRSARVDKRTREIFLASRSGRMLREGELAARCLYYPATSEGGYLFRSGHLSIRLQTIDDSSVYRLSNSALYMVREEEVIHQVHSWRDYARLTGKTEEEVFTQTIVTADESDVPTLCTCVLLLLNKNLIIVPFRRMKALPPRKEDRFFALEELIALYSELRDDQLFQYEVDR